MSLTKEKGQLVLAPEVDVKKPEQDQNSKNSTVFKESLVFMPRTNRDFQQLSVLVALGLSNQTIFRRLTTQAWRTQLVIAWGRQCCATCYTPISPSWCSDCGEPNFWQGRA